MLKYFRNLVMIMKKIELLAPAGNMKCLHAAVEAGCDAVYLSGNCFGARAFAKNFSDCELVEAINYCHLYGVRVYVTVNTLLYEDEIDDFIKYIDFIHKNNVDAIIIQDLGMFDLVRKTFPNLEIHSSTQMHIHNLDGTQLMEKLGAKRVVLARETSIEQIKHIKENSNIELEIFVHGALCISYSGQCLMSSLIGGRSGNRGQCAGSCRLKYDVIDELGNKLNKDDYPLSTKDLNTLSYVGELIEAGVASLKIEGRMKSSEYVYTVVSLYRAAIDSYYQNGIVSINNDKLLELKKIFNRDYTKGFLFNANNNDIINGYRPNHLGVKVGTVVGYKKGIVQIKLIDSISIGSGLRVIDKNGDVGINVNDFYVANKLVKRAYKGDTISIRVLDKVSIGSEVVITYDKDISNNIEKLIDDRKRRVLIKGLIVAKVGQRLELSLDDGENKITVFGGIVNPAVKTPLTKEDIYNKINKLGDTVYKLDRLDTVMDDNIFIPISEINELRREGINKLNSLRLYSTNYKRENYYIDVPDYKREKLVTCLLDKIDKLDRQYDIVYSYQDNDTTIKKLPRVINKYPDNISGMLVSEVGALNKRQVVDTDNSLNVTNSYTVAFLHSLGVRKVTLSYELNDIQIKQLIDGYTNRYKKHPNLELIVQGYEEVMISKFRINEFYKNNHLYLRDRYGNKYKIIERDKLTYIYNYHKREMTGNYYEMGINSVRYNRDC